MRKFKLFFACMLMTLFSVGQVWAGDELYKTAAFTIANCTSNSSYTGSVTCTVGTDSWTAAYAANNNGKWDYIKMGGKRPSTGGSTVHTGTIVTSASYSEAITKVVVNGSLDRGSVSAKLIYASDAAFTSDKVESSALTAFTDGKMTFTIASPVANRYYKLEFECTNGTTTNGVISISSVEYYVASSTPTCATPTFSKATGVYKGAQDVTISCETSGATIHYTTDGTDPTTSSPTYSSAIPVSATATIKALAVLTNYDNSNIASATYAIVEHAGTEVDPYSAADVKNVIDVMGTTTEDVYATGIVSNVVTYTLPADGYINFYFSADGLTSGQQIEAYKCYNIGGEAFSAVTDVQTGATVVVKGKLKKYNSTYEFDQNCHLVSYQAPAVPKTHIANTKETAYSVADAIGYAADGVHYDLDDYVYVRGVVYDVKSFDNGVMNIFIKDADAENQFELYKCAGINDGSSTTSFEALTDVKVGDIVIGYGQLTVYNTMSELKQGNYLADLKHVYTVRFWNTADGWGETINAHVWNTNGNVTEWPGVATTFAAGWNEMKVEQGNSLLFCTSDGSAQTADIDNIQADVCYVLTGEADDKGHLVVATTDDCDDRFYIAGDEALTGDNWNTTADRLVNGSITFTNIAANTYKFKITNGTWKWNIGGAKVDAGACSGVTIKDTDSDGNVVFSIDEAKDITITYNKATDKIVVTAVDYVAPVEPEYRAIVVAYGDKYYAMTKTLDNKGFTPVEVTIDGENNVIVPSAADSISIMWKFNEGTGTATFQDGENKYLAHTGTGTDLTLQAADTENPEVWTWDADNKCYYVAVTKDNKTTNRSFFYQETANKFKNYGVESNLGQNGYSGAPTFYAPNKVKVSTTAKLRFFAPVEWEDDVYAFTWAEDYSGNHQMTAVEEGSRWFECDLKKGVEFLVRKGNGDIWTGQTVNIPALEADKCYAWAPKDGDGKFTVATIASCEMNYYLAGDDALLGTSGNQGWAPDARALNANNSITFNEVAANIQENPYKFKITNGTWNWNLGGAYVDQTACSGVTIEDTDGDGNAVFSIAIKSNITITYNPATEKISIVAVASTPEILVDKAEIAFGTVDYEDAVDAEIINVTLISVANATISLSGDADAFQLDKDALTASGIVSVTPVTTTAGTFNATLTISDAASAAETKEIALSLTVNEAPAVDDINGTWNLVTSADQLAANKKVIIAKYVDADETVTLGMTQNTNNRAQVEGATVTGNVLVPAQGTAVFTLEAGTEDGTWAFKSSANEYLYAASSTKNWLRSQAENDANGSWAISITNGVAGVVAQGENTRNIMRYNNSDHLFSCYASGQQDIALYMLEEEEPEPVYETVRSGLEPDRYYTVCYDKTMKKIRGASLWSFNGKDANMAYIVEAEAPYIAGTPYLIYAESDKLEAITEAVDNLEAGSNNGLYGTLTEMSNAQLLAAGATHLLVNNELRPLGNGYLKENRAYVKLGEIQNATPTPSNAPGKRVRAIPMHQDSATGIDELNASEKPVKMVIDGQLYILRGEKMYDATGRLVK